MSRLLVRLLLEALQREQLTGNVDVAVSTLVATRMQETLPGVPEVDPDDVRLIELSNDGLTAHWRHDRQLPQGTVSWQTVDGPKVVSTVSLLR